MADVSNLKIDERLNVERPNLRGNENWEDKNIEINLYQRASNIWNLEKLLVVRNIELKNN